MVHRNFEQTEEMVMNLLAMSSKLDSLQDMLADDSSQTLGSHPNLLPLHFQLKQLEGFKNQTLHQAKKASPKARDTLNRYFERLNGVITEFDDYLVGLAGNILDLTRAGNGDVVVRLFKIAEVEGREDEKVRFFYSLQHFLASDIRSSRLLLFAWSRRQLKWTLRLSSNRCRPMHAY